MNFVIFDFEVIPFTDHLLEIAVIKTDNLLNVIDEIEVRTNIAWPDNKVVIGKYSQKEALEIFRYMVNSEDTYISCRLPYKRGLLKSWNIELNRTWDILTLAEKYKPLHGFWLSPLASIMGIKEIDPNRALGDCLTMYDILKKTIDVKIRQ